MGIALHDFASLHHATFKNTIKARFSEIIDNGSFIEGPYNAQFEQRFAKMQGANHCALVANGTDALQIALQVVGVKAGDKVGIPGISFFATAEAVITVGATPIFIDVDAATGLMDYKSLESAIARHRLQAIMPVHIYGQPAPIAELNRLCMGRDIQIVEDGAQAMGTFYEDGRPVGSSGNLVTFSFYPTKNLSAFGDAGAILTQDQAQLAKIHQYRNHGRAPTGHAISGYNSRCDHLQAAVLDLKLDNIEVLNQQRKALARHYHQRLHKTGLRLVPEKFLALSSWHLYPIGLKNVSEKMALQEHLKVQGIASALFYSKSLPEELPLQAVQGEKVQAAQFAATTLCLPIHPFLQVEQVELVCQEVEKFLALG